MIPPVLSISLLLSQNQGCFKQLAGVVGTEKLSSLFLIAGNRKQIYNARNYGQSENDNFAEFAYASKREKETHGEFKRSVGIDQEVSFFVASKQILVELEGKFQHFGLDKTKNNGQLYVTVTSYRHLFFHNSVMVHSVIIGLCLTHFLKTTTSYSNLLAKIMKGNKNLQNILLFEQI